jgi:hypothetical protein
LTSLTQILSQSVVQQYGSFTQTSSAQVLHVSVRWVPAEQTLCLQVLPPPPLLLPLELPELLPLELPELLPLELPLLLPPLLLPPPVQLVPQ